MENQRVNDKQRGIEDKLSIRDSLQKKQEEDQVKINEVEYKKQIEELNQEVKEIKEQLSSTQDLIYREISTLFIANGSITTMVGAQIGNLGIEIIGLVLTIAGCYMSLSNYKTKNESKKNEKQ
jgi:hypothetical protein